jgi:protein O-mannosyl-transferase
MKKLKPTHCYFILAVFSFLVFYNTLQNDFVFDDESVVQNYMAIRDLSNIPKFFTAQEGFHKVIGRYYRPVVSTTYTIDYAFWGLNPYGFHLTNIIINSIATLFLFAILSRLFKKYKYGLLASLISTAIFTAHPVHTEAVSWVSGRTDSLVTLFFFATFYFYILYLEEYKNKYIIVSLIFYVLGLLSKEMIVTFPLIIILFDFLWRNKSFREILENWKTYSIYILLTIIYLVIRYLVLKDVPERVKYNYFYEKDVITIIATMLKTIPVYLKLLVFPVGLLYHYNGVIPDSNSFFDGGVIFSIVLILVLLVLSAVFYKKFGKISFCILFVFVTLLPVMNIVQTMNFMAERFLYFSSFALILLIAYLFSKYLNEKNKNIIISLSLIIVIIFTYLTVLRNYEWKDNDTLYLTGEGKDGSVLLVNIGNIFANRKQYDEAEKRYRKAIEIRYNNILAHHNLGLIFLLKGNLDSAEIKIKEGLAIDSLAPDGYFQLANIYQQKGRLDDAINMLEKLQTVVPDYRGSKSQLEMMKSIGSSTDKNIPPNIQKQFNPNQVSMLEKRSFKYYQDKKYNEAIKDIEEMMRISPTGKSGYLNNLALCYQGLGNENKTKECFEEAIKLDEKNINALAGLADFYAQKNEKNKSIEYYKKILNINPSDENAKRKIDSLSVKN